MVDLSLSMTYDSLVERGNRGSDIWMVVGNLCYLGGEENAEDHR